MNTGRWKILVLALLVCWVGSSDDRGRDRERGRRKKPQREVSRHEKKGHHHRKDVVFTGAGCPKDTSAILESDDGSSVSVLFSDFAAEAGGETKQPAVRSTCDFTLPIKIPEGMSLAVYKIDYRGFHTVPQQGKGSLEIEYDLGNDKDRHRSPRYRKHFQGPRTGDYTLTDTLDQRDMKFIGCAGGTINLNVRAVVLAESDKDLNQATFALDTVDAASGDLVGGLTYKMQFKKCKDK